MQILFAGEHKLLSLIGVSFRILVRGDEGVKVLQQEGTGGRGSYMGGGQMS